MTIEHLEPYWLSRSRIRINQNKQSTVRVKYLSQFIQRIQKSKPHELIQVQDAISNKKNESLTIYKEKHANQS